MPALREVLREPGRWLSAVTRVHTHNQCQEVTMFMGVPKQPREPFRQLLDLLEECDEYEASDLDA